MNKTAFPPLDGRTDGQADGILSGGQAGGTVQVGVGVGVGVGIDRTENERSIFILQEKWQSVNKKVNISRDFFCS